MPGAALLAVRPEPVGCIWRGAHSLVMHKAQGVRSPMRMAVTKLTAVTDLTSPEARQLLKKGIDSELYGV